MRLQSFLENYVADDTYISIICNDDESIQFEGYKSEISQYPDIAEATGDLGLWLQEVYAVNDTLVILITY